MKRGLLLTPAAEQDIEDIWYYLFQRNETVAERWSDHLEKRFSELQSYPELGPAREEIQTRLRHLLIAPYLILYRFEEDRVVITRVIDGRRDLSKL